MSSELTIYFCDNSEIRVFEIDGELWFVLSDILIFLGTSTNTYNAIKSVEECFGEGCVFKTPLQTSGGMQNVTLVKECGVTYLVSRSRTEAGKRLNNLIHNEILPSIRKTGSYSVSQKQFTFDDVQKVVDLTAQKTAELTAKAFAPYVAKCQQMEETYEKFPGLKTLVEKIQNHIPENPGRKYTLKEAILLLGRPRLNHGESIRCGQLVCGWLELHFNQKPSETKPTRYQERFLPIIDYAIQIMLKRRVKDIAA